MRASLFSVECVKIQDQVHPSMREQQKWPRGLVSHLLPLWCHRTGQQHLFLPGHDPNGSGLNGQIMKVLTLNAGSASLKFDLIENGSKLFSGAIEEIGKTPVFSVMRGKDVASQEPVSVRDYGEATRYAIGKIGRKPDLVGHRVVHGADRFAGPTVLNEEITHQIEELEELAPLHNVSAVSAIRAAREALGSDIGMVAVFDTVFHRTIPPHARYYALSPELTDGGRIHRYGFHGISHEYMRDRYAHLTGIPTSEVNAVTLHLESGCSACAIRNGRSVDTSMGFTPLEGLVMGKRSGDIDPAIIGYLVRKKHMQVDRIEELLNKDSGLLGLSGVSHDTRELMKHMDTNERVRHAMDVFCYRALKYVGAYLGSVNGARAVVFGGGIGEDTPFVRERVCAGLEWCGVRVDPELNRSSINKEICISTPDSSLQIWIVLVEESLSIARQAEECWKSRTDREA
jgi:acetate kinase